MEHEARRRTAAIPSITGDRCADVSELGTDLMRASGLDMKLQKRTVTLTGAHRGACDRALRFCFALQTHPAAAALRHEPVVQRARVASPSDDRSHVALVGARQRVGERGVARFVGGEADDAAGALVQALVRAEVVESQMLTHPRREVVGHLTGRLRGDARGLVDHRDPVLPVKYPSGVEGVAHTDWRSASGIRSEGEPVATTQSWCAARVAAMCRR